MTEFRSEAAWQTRGREDGAGHSSNGAIVSQETRTEPSHHSQPKKRTPAPGRRIYIYEGSLARLARQGREAARLIYETLAQVSVLKVLHHQVLQDGVQLGWISKEGAQQLSRTLDPKGSEAVTRCLHSIGYRTEPHRGPRPLLGNGEEVVASCYFDQYYTFATGEEMADQMYRDLRPIAEVRRLRESGEDYKDLLLINGSRSPSLELLGRRTEAKDAFSEPEAAKVRMEALGAVRRELTEAIESVPLNGKERAFVIDRLQQALAEVFSRGVLKTL